MLTFFRRIRKDLLDDGATRKYIPYALGEILLVMIRILLALQVNNWNERRKEYRETAIIKHNLINEFVQNRTVLNKGISLLEKSIEHSKSLLQIMGSGMPVIEKSIIDSILTHAFHNSIGFSSFRTFNGC